METYEEILSRHKRELDGFRASCCHKESSWLLQEWAPGHIVQGEVVKICLVCNQVLGKSCDKEIWNRTFDEGVYNGTYEGTFVSSD